MKFLNCTYDAIVGKIVSNWNIEKDGRLSFHFEIPFGTTAMVCLPDSGMERFQISAGTYDYKYQPTKDYLQRYTMESRLEDFSENLEAINILEKELPIAAGMIAGGDKENLALTLQDLYYMEFLGFTKQTVDRAAEKLLNLKVCL